MTPPFTPARLAELDALLADQFAEFGDVAVLAGEASAALRAAWADIESVTAAYSQEAERCSEWKEKAEDRAARVAELEAELATARGERDQWRTYAHDVEGVTQSIAEIMTGEPDTSGIVHRVKEIRAERDRLESELASTKSRHTAIYNACLQERDRLAARLAEAEELLRPFATWARNIAEIDPVAQPAYDAAAAFIARTEPAK